ncbi:MAG: pyruvate kinase, partial [Pseudomonadota bacterium]
MRNRFCKIVATVGPASWSPAMLALLNKAGVDIFRLNMSHGDHAKTKAVADALRILEKETGTPIGVFADLQG